MFTLTTAILTAVCCPKADPPADGVKVTVVVVLATTDKGKVPAELSELAKEVQKRDKSLQSFAVHTSEAKDVAVGDTVTFVLIDKQELKVKVEKPKDGKGKVGLTIKPPDLGEVTYTCTCDKYFPVVTPYKTANGETLIVAVMAKPCAAEKK